MICSFSTRRDSRKKARSVRCVVRACESGGLKTRAGETHASRACAARPRWSYEKNRDRKVGRPVCGKAETHRIPIRTHTILTLTYAPPRVEANPAPRGRTPNTYSSGAQTGGG